MIDKASLYCSSDTARIKVVQVEGSFAHARVVTSGVSIATTTVLHDIDGRNVSLLPVSNSISLL